MTSQQAAIIADVLELEGLLSDWREIESMETHSPDTLAAYRALLAYAEQSEEV